MGEVWSSDKTCSVGLVENEGIKTVEIQNLIINVQCTTLQYIQTLEACCDILKEVIEIFAPIRSDSSEGKNGIKVTFSLIITKNVDFFQAKSEMIRLENQLKKLKEQTNVTFETLKFRRSEKRFNRRSLML